MDIEMVVDLAIGLVYVALALGACVLFLALSVLS